jgi:hypothetical protein
MFSELDCYEFMSNKDNFSFEGYSRYLVNFTKKKEVTLLNKFPPLQATEFICLFFEEIIETVNAMIVKGIIAFCVRYVEHHLYD